MRDSAIGEPIPYAAPGDPDIDGVLAALTATVDRFGVAAALTAYDRRVDGSGTIAIDVAWARPGIDRAIGRRCRLASAGFGEGGSEGRRRCAVVANASEAP